MVRFEHPFHHGSTRPINAAQVTAASVRSLKDEVASLRSQLEAERQAKADGSASRGWFYNAGSGRIWRKQGKKTRNKKKQEKTKRMKI